MVAWPGEKPMAKPRSIQSAMAAGDRRTEDGFEAVKRATSSGYAESDWALADDCADRRDGVDRTDVDRATCFGSQHQLVDIQPGLREERYGADADRQYEQ